MFFWLLKTEIEAEPGRWEWICDLLLDVYIWWAEGIHLRPQPQLRRGSRLWLPAFINELLEDALPYDSTTSSDPIRTAALDAHLGEALMQITAVVHASLPARRTNPSDQGTLRANYRRSANGTFVFAAGGTGYFGPLCHRINAANWRPTGVFPADAHLPAIDLSGEDCSMISFDETNMANASLRGANLVGTIFSGVNLRKATVTKANLASARFTDCDLSGAHLAGSNLQEAYLRETDLSEADLEKVNLHGAVLSRCDMKGARLTGVNLHRSCLRETVLARADLKEANLHDAVLNHCDMSDARLTGANLHGSCFRDTNLARADLEKANLHEAVLIPTALVIDCCPCPSCD